jgi:hypothetical protein
MRQQQLTSRHRRIQPIPQVLGSPCRFGCGRLCRPNTQTNICQTCLQAMRYWRHKPFKERVAYKARLKVLLLRQEEIDLYPNGYHPGRAS